MNEPSVMLTHCDCSGWKKFASENVTPLNRCQYCGKKLDTPPDNWILCRERMPEKSTCTTWNISRTHNVTDGASSGMGYYDFDGEFWSYRLEGRIEQHNNKIVAYQPLPEITERIKNV